MKMKIPALIAIFLSLVLISGSLTTYAQCEPMTAEECPDPENNGQVCPDTLSPGFLNQYYSVVATILPPAAIDTLGFQIDINHITLDSVVNLPKGITWESNAADNEFYPGTYYCILMAGIPTVADTFHLKIYIGIFVELLGDTIRVTQLVDSTSLSIIIIDNTGLLENPGKNFFVLDNYPNPFDSWTSIRYYAENPGPVEFELYSSVGARVDSRKFIAQKGENYFHYLGDHLNPGTYFYTLRSGSDMAAGRMIRKR